MAKDFKTKVLALVAKIPYGQILTYGQVATRAGCPKAARAVGQIMQSNYCSGIPCHRVVAARSLGGYNRGLAKKKALLTAEGVDMSLLAAKRSN